MTQQNGKEENFP